MIIAGPCLFTDMSESGMIHDTAHMLKKIGVEWFRCKLWGGGTTPEKYFPGVGDDGLKLMKRISEIMPVCTEVQTPEHTRYCAPVMDMVWVGARNSSNYALRKSARESGIPFAIKRAANMPVELVYGMFDIEKPHYIIERGIDNIFARPESRFMPDLKGVMQIKNERPDIFDKLIVDCSHSVFRKDMVADTYRAFKSIGIKHFMFECTLDGSSKTDQSHMLSVKELTEILEESK